MSKGGGGPQQTTSDVTQTTTNLPPYAEPYYLDLLSSAGYESAQKYIPYGGQRIAGFSPFEQAGQAAIGALGTSGTPASLDAAGKMAFDAGQNYNSNIGSVGAYNQADRNSGYTGAGAHSGYVANQRGSGYTSGGNNQYNVGFDPSQRNVGFTPGKLNDASMLESYGDPYMQQVVDINKREAKRQSDIRGNDLGLSAAGAGSLGGYREAIMQAENERNLTQEMSDIQDQGSQQAFLQAKQAFEQDRQARAQKEQFGQSQFGLNTGQQQVAEQFSQSAFGANQQVQQRIEELQQQGFSLNESMRQAQEQYRQGAFGQWDASQQAAEQLAQAAHGQNLQSNQFGAGNDLARWQAQQQAISQQNQDKLSSAGMLGDYTQQRQDMELQRLQQLMATGQDQRNMAQSGLDMGYQDFLRQQGWGREQVAFMSSILQGANIAPGRTVSSFGPQPSGTSQALGSGIQALGLAQALGKGGS